ncbi:MAG: hypothetical protein M1825_001826 [Sarcosagium campestre]|nr:MAG: hypothetical protein M1825_001826 [Sarcosagium campestre]
MEEATAINPEQGDDNTRPSALPVTQQAAQSPLATGRGTNGTISSGPPAAVPLQAVEHGAPFRVYLNGKVTPSLIEGMKQLGLEQPRDPLRFLGEFLLQKSKELE